MIKAIRNIQHAFSHFWKKTNPFSFSESQQLQLASDLIPFGVWEYDLLSGFITWNQSMYHLLGVQQDDFDHTLSSFKEIIHPADRPGIEDVIHDAIHRPNQQKNIVFRIQGSNQLVKHIRGNIKLLYNKKKEPIKLTGVCIDITRQKNTELQLKKERDKAELYLDSVEAMVIVLNKDASIRLINQAGCKITGYEERDLLNKDWYEIFTPIEKREEAKAAFLKIINGEAVYLEYYEREIVTKSGEHKCIAWRNRLLYNEQNNIIGVLATGIDITAKVEAEKESEAMRKMYQDIFENSVAPMLICDAHLRYKDVNPAACELLGYSREELLKMHVWQLTRPDMQISTMMLWSDFIATKHQTGTIELFKKDGTKLIVEYQATSEFTPGMHFCSLMDITDKKTAERKLMSQNEKLRTIAWLQSHEVRKPLANILGLLSLMESQKTHAEHGYIFQYLKQSSDELDQIIRDIIEKTKAVDA
ncbi:MAG: PAS domain S-box protein [Chitinophagaceae bacterium]|nr:PAS domain S-box protein [Chitinophagaceae bacterium]